MSMRPNLISCHAYVREHREQYVDNIVGECPAIVRKSCRAARVVRKNVWQQLLRHAYCILRCIAACMFQFVREGVNEAVIIRWFSAEVRLPLLSGKKYRLHWSSTPVGLPPAFCSFVHCASPNSHLIASQSRAGQLDHDAANIFICEEIVPGELHVIEITVNVEKERVAAPTEEETVVAGFR